MREIKFRAWDSKFKKMHFDVVPAPPECPDKFWGYTGIRGEHYVFVEDEIITLLQYTGLKDRNGKEIYEGDIVSGSWSGNEEVRYQAPGWSPFYETDADGDTQFVDAENCEVIGNIYKNPELLK